MKVQIKPKKGVVNAKVATTNFQEILGHMFRTKISPLLLEFNQESKRASSVHTLFMFKTIDLVFINSKWEVADIKTAVPFQPYIAPRRPAKYVLELPKGMGSLFRTGETLKYEYY